MTSGTPEHHIDISGGQGTVVGDYATVFQVFASAPAPLASHIRTAQFRGTIEDRTRSFTGREFVFDAIDQTLRDDAFPSGYILLQGEPGIGKTALLAHLIKSRGYVHHLNIAPMGIRSPQAFLANVCAQLIVRYGLAHTFLPNAATQDGGFLALLLAEAAGEERNRPLVVVVDAIDEADDASTGTNRLFLPPDLPSGVFFVISTREHEDHRLYVDSRRDIYLRDDDPRNLADIAGYVTDFLRRHQLTRDGLTEVLVEHSEGNFMYVVHVLRDIVNGHLDFSDPRELPYGLRAYYQRHWNTMRSNDGELFGRYQEPVVCLLATAREPVTLDVTTEWTRQYWLEAGWDITQFQPRVVTDVVRDWRMFLNSERVGVETRYRVYHTSFQDFLRDDVGLATFHAAISSATLAKIPGFLSAPSGPPGQQP